MEKPRYLKPYIISDLKEKMVFIGGPRQVGKTTLCCKIIGQYFKKYSYYTWDNKNDRKSILSEILPSDSKLLIFDELHKYKKWKGLIKGQFDKFKDKYSFLITGSARLDLYRRGGDSLQGRYHYYRLHPFTLSEILNSFSPPKPFTELKFSNKFYQDILESLDGFGGFPEPFIKQNSRYIRRWHNEKVERLFREDIQDMYIIKDMGNLKVLIDILPLRAGNLLSINSIREDLGISFKAVSNWIDVFDFFYYLFRIYPFSSNAIRSLKKESKLYLWDWSEIEQESARFENLIASHLLKLVNFLIDYEGYKSQLYFIRDTDKRETDFLITINNNPWFAVEVKLNDEQASSNLLYFKKRLKIPYCYQVLKTNKIDKIEKDIRIISASRFLTAI